MRFSSLFASLRLKPIVQNIIAIALFDVAVNKPKTIDRKKLDSIFAESLEIAAQGIISSENTRRKMQRAFRKNNLKRTMQKHRADGQIFDRDYFEETFSNVISERNAQKIVSAFLDHFVLRISDDAELSEALVLRYLEDIVKTKWILQGEALNEINGFINEIKNSQEQSDTKATTEKPKAKKTRKKRTLKKTSKPKASAAVENTTAETEEIAIENLSLPEETTEVKEDAQTVGNASNTPVSETDHVEKTEITAAENDLPNAESEIEEELPINLEELPVIEEDSEDDSIESLMQAIEEKVEEQKSQPAVENLPQPSPPNEAENLLKTDIDIDEDGDETFIGEIKTATQWETAVDMEEDDDETFLGDIETTTNHEPRTEVSPELNAGQTVDEGEKEPPIQTETPEGPSPNSTNAPEKPDAPTDFSETPKLTDNDEEEEDNIFDEKMS